MINLLRKVRKEYLNQGNYRIYALYAVGEVFLVMMGILLALQVDNWNQNRQQKELELDNLENLFFSLNEDIQINSLILLTEYTLRVEDTWLAYLENESLRVLLSIIYDQHLPELQTSMSHFRERFNEERNLHFRKYFALGDEHLHMNGNQ